jgi:hypothetical protein
MSRSGLVAAISAGIAVAMLALMPATYSSGADGCAIVDLMPEYRVELSRPSSKTLEEQAAEFESQFVAAHAALYRPEVLGLANPEALHELIRKNLPDDRRRLDAIDLEARALHTQLPSYLTEFRAAFPDFHCGFTIYLMPSFGALDGAGRIVSGAPALVFGVDTIAAMETPEQLKVFVHHELFHRYHFQVAGFSDDENERAVIWKALWTEGLATFASATLNPGRPLSDALLVPRDLEARANPRVREIAKELRANMDLVAPSVFGKYFLYGNRAASEAGLPSRSGYYVGYLVARRLGQGRSLNELAHLQGSALRKQVAEALDELAAGPEPTLRGVGNNPPLSWTTTRASGVALPSADRSWTETRRVAASPPRRRHPAG